MKIYQKRVIVTGLSLMGLLIGVFLGWQQSPAIDREDSDETPINVLALKPSSKWVEGAMTVSLEEGIRLAKVRGEQMRALIRTDPELALREALSLSEWSALPPEVQAQVEQPFSALVNVEVLISCSADFSETTITTEFPTTGMIETFVYGQRSGLGSKNGTPVQGIRMDGIGALREDIFQSLDAADEAAALALFPVAVADPGGDSLAALAGGRVFYFKSRAAFDEANARLAALEELPGPDAGAQTLFQSVEAYMLEDGSIDFQALEEIAFAATEAWTGTPRDMYVILVDFSDVPGQPTDPVALSNSVNTTISQQILDMSYEKTHIICTVNPTTYRMPETNEAYTNSSLLFTHATNAVAGVDLSPYETVCIFHPPITGETYAGLASVGGSKMWLKSASEMVITHELGHNYGSLHASSWAVPTSDPVDPSGTSSEYGDFTDIMGSGKPPAGHFNALHKKRVGWLEPENLLAVTNSGTYRVYRFDHRETTEAVRALKINKGSWDHYWVGLRQEQTPYEFFSRGAYVLWEQSANWNSLLLDMTPNSTGGKYDGGLALGQTYSDTSAAAHMTAIGRGGLTPNEWMDITVNLGSFSGNVAPTASMSGPSTGAVQSSMLFSVVASDADGDELAYYWNTGDGLVKPNAAAIATAWLAGSTVTVICVVSDMKGGSTTVAQEVVLNSQIDAWTQRTSGTTQDMNDIQVGNGMLVAVGDGGFISYSSDGTSWTAKDTGNCFFEGITYDGAQFIAVGSNHGGGPWYGAVYTSGNGISWARRYLGGEELKDVAYGGGIYVAVGKGGTLLRSTNGRSWSSVASGTSLVLHNVAYGDGTFVVIGQAKTGSGRVLLASTNGLSWADHSSGLEFSTYRHQLEMEYVNNRFLAGGGYRSGIQYSTDQGQTFSEALEDRYEIDGFAYGNGIYLGTGVYTYTGRTNDINLISADGVTWWEIQTAQKDNQNAAAYFNNTFITVGDAGSIWQSDAFSEGSGGFANWQLENGEALGLNRDPLDDADFDGVYNLYEYAMGSSATDAGQVPGGEVATVAGSYFQVTYPRSEIKSDVDYTVERSMNLASNAWNSATTVIVNDTSTNLTVRSAYMISTQTNEFMRLNIELK